MRWQVGDEQIPSLIYPQATGTRPHSGRGANDTYVQETGLGICTLFSVLESREKNRSPLKGFSETWGTKTGQERHKVNFQHVAIKGAKAGAHPGGLRGLVEYNARLRQDLMTQAVRYIERDGDSAGKQDLVDKGHAHLPAWAESTVDFFRKAEQYGRANHWPARVIEIALPRELSAPAREALADAIRETYFSLHPHSWAIHNPTAQ